MFSKGQFLRKNLLGLPLLFLILQRSDPEFFSETKNEISRVGIAAMMRGVLDVITDL